MSERCLGGTAADFLVVYPGSHGKRLFRLALVEIAGLPFVSGKGEAGKRLFMNRSENHFDCKQTDTVRSNTMPLLAKDIMSQQYDIIHQDALVSQAVEQLLMGGTRVTGHKNVSLVVVDDNNALVGTISMYSILYHLRPSYQLFGIDSSDMAVDAEVEVFVKTVQKKRVRDIMNSDVITVSPEEPMMNVLDRLMRNRIRRIPVVDKGVMVGLIYMTDIFHHLFDNTKHK